MVLPLRCLNVLGQPRAASCASAAGLAVTKLWRHVVVDEQGIRQIRCVTLMSRFLGMSETIRQPPSGFGKALGGYLPKNYAVLVQSVVRHASEGDVPKLHRGGIINASSSIHLVHKPSQLEYADAYWTSVFAFFRVQEALKFRVFSSVLTVNNCGHTNNLPYFRRTKS
jgi:hypothetical protein